MQKESGLELSLCWIASNGPPFRCSPGPFRLGTKVVKLDLSWLQAQPWVFKEMSYYQNLVVPGISVSARNRLSHLRLQLAARASTPCPLVCIASYA